MNVVENHLESSRKWVWEAAFNLIGMIPFEGGARL